MSGVNTGYFQPEFPPFAAREERPMGGLTTWGDQLPLRKPSEAERSSRLDISESCASRQNSQIALDQDLTNLRKAYGFPPDDSVATFLSNHRAVASVLLSAVPHLKKFFGADSIVNLEVSTDDNGLQTLYAVAVWHDTVRAAAQALEDFTENWWLDNMTASTADLAFTYEIF